jgi:hypothetical protein
MDSQEELERQKRRKKNTLIGLGIAGVAATAVGGRGMYKAMKGITKLKKGSVGRLGASTALAGVGAATAMSVHDSLKRPYKQGQTDQQYT